MNNSILIDTSLIKQLINQKATIIDIRDREEFNKMHIKTSINIPYEHFNINNFPIDFNTPIYLICYSGTKSKTLASKLRKQGYNAYSFLGGFYALEHKINNSYF